MVAGPAGEHGADTQVTSQVPCGPAFELITASNLTLEVAGRHLESAPKRVSPSRYQPQYIAMEFTTRWRVNSTGPDYKPGPCLNYLSGHHPLSKGSGHLVFLVCREAGSMCR